MPSDHQRDDLPHHLRSQLERHLLDVLLRRASARRQDLETRPRRPLAVRLRTASKRDSRPTEHARPARQEQPPPDEPRALPRRGLDPDELAGWSVAEPERPQ